MDEKEQKSLTVGDILDQLVKPSVIQGPVAQTTPQLPRAIPPISTPPVRQSQTGGLNLPSLGGDIKKDSIPSSPSAEEPKRSFSGKPSELKLSIRTMADDIARMRQGVAPSGFDIQKTIIPGSELKKDLFISSNKDELVEKTSRPVVPPDFDSQKLQIPSLSKNIPDLSDIPSVPKVKVPFWGRKKESPSELPDRPPHIHEEIQISDNELLPPFPGAPIPKRPEKRREERFEYGAVAKVISSGMTTGILSTILVAVVIYFALSFFIFRGEELITPTPTPTPIGDGLGNGTNELETIFSTVSSITYILSSEDKGSITKFRAFVGEQKMSGKEFKKVNFKAISQEKSNLTFTELLDQFSVKYPTELKDWIKDNNTTFLYGQEEASGDESKGTSDKRVIFIVEVKDVNRTNEIMRNWESTMPNDLRNVFDLDPSSQATINFLDNERRGVMIRYKNFPLPDKAIDYAIISSLTGRYYLILANSREAMYSPADKIRGL